MPDTPSKCEAHERYDRTISDHYVRAAAAASQPYNVDQLVRVLGPGRAVPEYGDDGTPTGELVTRVTITSKGADGKPKQLDTDPVTAVGVLRVDPEYANLWLTRDDVRDAGGDDMPRDPHEYMAERRRRGR